MSSRRTKQVAYGIFYLAVFGLVVWAVAAPFLRRAVPPAAPLVGQPVAVLGVNVFAASAGYDTFLAKVANPNPDLAAQYFDYSFNLYDASGTLITSFPGRSFLYGGEVKYLLLPNQAIPGAVATADLTVPTATIAWVATSTFGGVPALAVENVATRVGSSTAVAAGNLVDNDIDSFSDIVIIAVFKDAAGDPVGASQTEVDGIAPNQIEPFAVIYPALADIDPAATEVEAYAAR